MKQPTNSAAEQIVSLTSINADIDTQIATLQATQQRNLETIAAFEQIAEWEDVEEEVSVTAEPELEVIPEESELPTDPEPVE